MFKAFEGKPFSHKGKYYTIPPEVPYRGYALKEITLVPAPERLPVECWQPIQSGSERAFDFMAKHGICGVIGGGSAEGGAVERHMIGVSGGLCSARHQARTRRAAGARLPVPHLLEPRAGDPRGRPALRRKYENVWRIAAGARPDRRADCGDARSPAGRFDQTAAHRGRGERRRFPGWPAGRHRRAAQGGREALPRDRPVICATPLGTPLDVQLEDLDRFAKDVIPAFRRAPGSPPRRSSSDQRQAAPFSG